VVEPEFLKGLMKGLYTTLVLEPRLSPLLVKEAILRRIRDQNPGFQSIPPTSSLPRRT
jgi:hypothetical protein